MSPTILLLIGPVRRCCPLIMASIAPDA
jgi:hypothetical protein